MTALVPDGDRFATILARGLVDVIDELHRIDPVDLVSFIRFGRFTAIEDLLQSSTELFFREGTLTFGWTATVAMEWDVVPAVTLGMEFRNRAVSVFFNLTLRGLTPFVSVDGIAFDPPCCDLQAGETALMDAVADALLPKRPQVSVRLHPRDGTALLPR